MKQYLRFFSALIILALLAVWSVGCSRAAKQAEKAGPQYPAPRFPSYLKAPQTVDEILPNARALVRNASGFQGSGLGVVNPGETVAMVATAEAEDLVLEAIRRALEERKVKANILYDYGLMGVSREDARAFRKLRQNYTSEEGYMEASNWMETQFAKPEVPKKWLKERRPDLYDKLFPKNRDMSPHMKEVWTKLQRDNVGTAIRAYLTKHPEVKGVFWGKGGGTGLRRALHPMETKFLGVFTADNRWEVMGQVPYYPGDIWELSEEKEIEALVYVDKMVANDPEGTNVSADITQEMAERWAKGAYQRGHLYMFPNQATGRFGYSVVDYPAFQKQWLSREPLALLNGVIAGTNGHGGFFPRWEVTFKEGYIVDVKGGGVNGELLRELLNYPRIKELTFPFHNHPGFWYMYEIAFGTHPKAFRNPYYMERGSLGPERLRSGVIHWGLGIRLWHDPTAPVESKSWLDFTAKYDMPRDHGFHTHTYFTTYKLHLRNTDKWLTLLDKGHMTSLDDPEVRALASRYGDPNSILAEDWTPEVPGINAPGQYEDYARDPWTYSKAVTDRAQNGTYAYYYPKGKPAPIDYMKVHAAKPVGSARPE